MFVNKSRSHTSKLSKSQLPTRAAALSDSLLIYFETHNPVKTRSFRSSPAARFNHFPLAARRLIYSETNKPVKSRPFQSSPAALFNHFPLAARRTIHSETTTLSNPAVSKPPTRLTSFQPSHRGRLIYYRYTIMSNQCEFYPTLLTFRSDRAQPNTKPP